MTAGLIATGAYNIWAYHIPETTIWGIIISLVSILVMGLLVLRKTYVGEKLDNDAILTDAECSRTCLYMSVVLLGASGLYEFF